MVSIQGWEDDSVKCLLFEHENREYFPNTHVKACIVARTCNPSASRYGQVAFGTHWSIRLSYPKWSFPGSLREPIQVKIRWKIAEGIPDVNL